MRNLFLLTVTVLTLSALFSQPMSHYLSQAEAGFPIEKLTYTPPYYAGPDESSYFKLSKDIPNQIYIETKFESESYYFNFIQSENNETLRVYLDAIESGTYYNKESITINNVPGTILYFRDGNRRFTWVRRNKRYQITTNDNYLLISDIERIDEGLTPIAIDFFKSLRKLGEGLASLWSGFVRITPGGGE